MTDKEQLINKVTEFVTKYAQYFRTSPSYNSNNIMYGIQFDFCDNVLRGCYSGAYTNGGYDYGFVTNDKKNFVNYVYIRDGNMVCSLSPIDKNKCNIGSYSESLSNLSEEDLQMMISRFGMMVQNGHAKEIVYDKVVIFCKGVAQLDICEYELKNRGFICYKTYERRYLRGNLYIAIQRNGYKISKISEKDAIPFGKDCLDDMMINKTTYIPVHEYTKLK